jgi:hypothetical protein
MLLDDKMHVQALVTFAVIKKNIRCLLFFPLLLFVQQLQASDALERSGEIISVLIPIVAYGATFVLDDSDGRIQFYKSLVTNLALTYGLKSVINKERPNGADKSFPSGHTSAAFMGASFIHRRYGFKYSIPAYIGASFTGYSRVESDNHYVEDVIAGAAIGIASSFIFTKPLSCCDQELWRGRCKSRRPARH